MLRHERDPKCLAPVPELAGVQIKPARWFGALAVLAAETALVRVPEAVQGATNYIHDAKLFKEITTLASRPEHFSEK